MMRYERPAIERKVKVTSPVIAGIQVGSLPDNSVSPMWAPHTRDENPAADAHRRSR